jgi:hypothetical protein
LAILQLRKSSEDFGEEAVILLMLRLSDGPEKIVECFDGGDSDLCKQLDLALRTTVPIYRKFRILKSGSECTSDQLGVLILNKRRCHSEDSESSLPVTRLWRLASLEQTTEKLIPL